MTLIASSQILVLGVGNEHGGDEALGLRAADLAGLRLHSDVQVLAVGAISPATIAELDGMSHIVVFACIDVGRAPGTVVRFDADDLSPCAARSVHRFGVADLLACVGQTSQAPQEAIVLGIQPASVEAGPALSPEVEAAVPRLVDEAASIVAGWIDGRRSAGRGQDKGPCLDPESIRLV
jgi:hydrogenase maturation protease